MDESEGYRFQWGRFFAWLPVYLVIGFALYVLSVGPLYWQIYAAYRLEENSYLAPLYLPLVVLSQVSDTFARWMDWYIGLWVL